MVLRTFMNVQVRSSRDLSCFGNCVVFEEYSGVLCMSRIALECLVLTGVRRDKWIGFRHRIFITKTGREGVRRKNCEICGSMRSLHLPSVGNTILLLLLLCMFSPIVNCSRSKKCCATTLSNHNG